MRLTFRLIVEGKLTFEETVAIECADLDEETVAIEFDDLERLARKHAHLVAGREHMIEIEFLDEPDPQKRFFRMGTDPTQMVQPIAVDLTKLGRKH